MSPELTIIICTYNREASLESTLKSLSRQEGIDKDRAWEIIVVDNNSNDKTKEIVQRFSKNHNIRYIFENKQGKSFALNTGIKNANAQILAFTDDDVIVDPYWVASIFKAVKLNPHYLAFGGKVVPIWPDKIPSWIQKEGPYSKPIVGSAIVSHDHGDLIKEYDVRMWIPPGCNVFFKRKVFELFGGYREDLGPRPGKPGFYHEDSEFGFRLKKNGVNILYFPKARVYHPVDEKRLTKTFMVRYFWNSGLAYYFKRVENSSKLFNLKKTILDSIQNIKLTARYGQTLLGNNDAEKMHYLCRILLNSGLIFSNIKRLFQF